jgi:hypothetical protein
MGILRGHETDLRLNGTLDSLPLLLDAIYQYIVLIMNERKEVKQDIKKIVFITSFLTTIAIIFLLWFYKIPLNTSFEIIKHFTLITGIIQTFFFLFIKIVWKWNIIPKSMRIYLDIPPDLSGRWEGECICKGSVEEFVVEIKQDYLNLSYQIFTKKHSGERNGSKVDTAVLFVNSNDNYSVITTWCDGGSVKEDENLVDSQRLYKGTSTWEITDDKNSKKPSQIEWNYYTNRNTTGHVSVNIVSKKRLGGFYGIASKPLEIFAD